MEIRVINDESKDFGDIFKVIRMNFDKIMVKYPDYDGLKNFSFGDVKCIGENEIDEFLIKNRDFLKIKLKRGISVVFYKALYESLKFEIKEEIENLNVLRDKYSINGRKIWEKEILLLVNNKFPIEVMASGQNFKRNGYNIIINKMEKDNFLEICYAEIENIKDQISLKKGLLYSFEDAIQYVEDSIKTY
jgi:hypothetical protein